MEKLGFATECDFRRFNCEKGVARKRYNQGIKEEFRKHHKIFSNDYRHVFSSGMPFGTRN